MALDGIMIQKHLDGTFEFSFMSKDEDAPSDCGVISSDLCAFVESAIKALLNTNTTLKTTPVNIQYGVSVKSGAYA